MVPAAAVGRSVCRSPYETVIIDLLIKLDGSARKSALGNVLRFRGVAIVFKENQRNKYCTVICSFRNFSKRFLEFTRTVNRVNNMDTIFNDDIRNSETAEEMRFLSK